MEPAFKATALVVVEKDDLQRSLVTVLLEESEMNVIQCDSAEAAVSVLDRSGEGISRPGPSARPPRNHTVGKPRCNTGRRS